MNTTQQLELLEYELWRRWRLKVSDQVSNGLTNNELDYLYALNRFTEGSSLSELAEKMNVSRASASNMVSKLEIKGFITKIKNSGDGRGIRLIPTSQTKSLSHLEQDIYQQADTTFQTTLSESEYKQFTQLFAKAVSGLSTENNK